MAQPWFFLADVPEDGVVTLDHREARHASGARRLSVGDSVQLFDGRGMLAVGELVSVSPRRVDVQITSHERLAPPARALHIASSLPKGDRQSTMISMATQLGLTDFTPLMTERTIVKPSGGFGERARRVSIEACKQCRCPFLPTIHEGADLASAIDAAMARGDLALFAHPTGIVFGELAQILTSPAAAGRGITMFFGPEGGFTDQEAATAAQAGVTTVSLGPTLLRVETAVVSLLAACALVLDDGRTRAEQDL